AVEDFDDAVLDLRKVGIVFCLLAAVMGFSLLWEAKNHFHLGLSLVSGGALFLAARVDYLKGPALTALTAIYPAAILLEYLYLGLPDLLVPLLNAEEWRGFPVFVNELTPHLYYLVKVATIFYVVRLWYYQRKVLNQPGEMLRQVDRQRFAGW
ncbi:MAG: hypothetical protein AAFZ52_19505, partial [Bacteroidota bacterium]